MPPPSIPYSVMTASPRTEWPLKLSRMDFSGWPLARPRKWSVQSTVKPQLAERRGAIEMPLLARIVVQSPVAPRRGQLAPPRARMVASACTGGASANSRLPSWFQPSQFCRVCSSTPCPASRRSQARSRGEAFFEAGNTRPELPTKVGSPSSADQARSASGGKAVMAGVSQSRASAYRPRKAANGSLCVRLRPPRPAISSLRPADGIRSYRSTCSPARLSRSAAISPAGPAPMTATRLAPLANPLIRIDAQLLQLAM